MIRLADNPLPLHPLDQGGGAVVADLQAALDVAGRGLAVAGDDGDGGFGGGEGSGNELYDQAVAVVTRDRKASTSYIQRRLQIGYNRAASLIERMEQDGVISSPNHKGIREVLLPEHEQR